MVGYGRAEKVQVQRMMKLLLGLDRVPSPHDAADALAVAVCHLHSGFGAINTASRSRSDRGGAPQPGRSASMKSWRDYKPRPRLRA